MRKVLTYGTFDLFHQGHYNILKRAREQGDYLIVGVTSESYDIERGKLSVKDSLTTRIENVKKTGFVDEVIIEEYLGQKIRDIVKYDIDVFVIGDDWKGKLDHLEKYCEVVYLERTKNISSTQIREQNNNIFRIGVITDNLEDGGILDEVKYVSGLHVENVLAPDKNLGEEFCNLFSIDRYHTDFESFADGLDIVMITTDVETREEYVRRCLEAGKHVICSAPVTLDRSKMEELFALAEEKSCALIEDITTVYLRAFTQLLWMVQGDIVGDVYSVKCSISLEDFKKKNTYLDAENLAVAMIVKLLGKKFDNIIKNVSGDCDSPNRFVNIFFTKGNAVGNIEIGNHIDMKCGMTIIGENATIEVKDDWWNTGYFELKDYKGKFMKRYCYNFEGNGFRYILQELLIMLRDKRNECTRLFKDESLAIIDIINQING